MSIERCIREALALDGTVDLDVDEQPEPVINQKKKKRTDDDESEDEIEENTGPTAKDMEALLQAAAEEQMSARFPDVQHSTYQATLGGLLGGSITTPTGQNQYIIPGFQRTYSWDAARASALAKDLIKLFNMGLKEHTLGDILLYKSRKEDAENTVLNGQQRMVTLYIMMSLLRCIATHKGYRNCVELIGRMNAFSFQLDQTGTADVRFKLRPTQQPFFESWFFNDPYDLWTDFFDTEMKNNLKEHLADIGGKTDLVLLRLLHAADAIRKELLNAPASLASDEEDHMVNNKDRLIKLLVYLRDSIKLGVGVLSGGGQHYCTWVFHQANFSQLTLTDLDMIKTDLISSGNMGAQKAAELADLWEQAQLNLGSHNIQCLNGRDAFRHSFYIARDLVVRDYGVGELNSVFKTSPPREVEDVMKLKDEPILFVDGYLAPTLDAMDKIFNWATSIRPPDSNTDNELRWLLDRVKTHITALLDMTTLSSQRRQYRPSMGFWMTIAVPLFSNLYDTSNKKKIELLVQMLHRLEAFTLWTALAGVQWGAVKGILVTGGLIKQRVRPGERGEQVKGVLKVLVPDGKKGVVIDTSTEHGKTSLARRLNMAQQSLSLTAVQLEKAAAALLMFESGKTRIGKPLSALIVRMHNDSLRGASAEDFVPAEEQDPKRIMLRVPGMKVQLEHILPHTHLNKSYCGDGWSRPEFTAWKDKPGNLVWQASPEPYKTANKPYSKKVNAYKETNIEILAYEKLPAGKWTPQDCKLRDREVILAVAQRIGIANNVMETTAASLTVGGKKKAADEEGGRWPPQPARDSEGDSRLTIAATRAHAAAGISTAAGSSAAAGAIAVARAPEPQEPAAAAAAAHQAAAPRPRPKKRRLVRNADR